MKTACRHPGCPAITVARHCGEHRTRDDRRPPAHRRGYDGEWRRTRNAYLEAHPFCEDPFDRHGGFPPDAVEVDHIVPLRDGGARLDWANLRGLCRGCHAKKTRREAS